MSFSSACAIVAIAYLFMAAAFYSDEHHERSLFATFQALVWAILAGVLR